MVLSAFSHNNTPEFTIAVPGMVGICWGNERVAADHLKTFLTPDQLLVLHQGGNIPGLSILCNGIDQTKSIVLQLQELLRQQVPPSL